MELRRVGEALVRSPLTFLIPAISSRCQPRTYMIVNSSQRKRLQHVLVTPSCHTTRRCITTSATNTPAAPIPKPLTPGSSPDWLSLGTGQNRSKFYPRGSFHRSSPEDQALLNNGNSSDDLLSAINASRSLGSSSGGFDPTKVNHSSTVPSSKTGYQMMRDMRQALTDAMPARERLRLTPQIGRTIHVGGSVDVGKGFRLLAQSCARNKIKGDFNYQKFHERPGLKRKRLKSQRWRKRFMLAFKATISRVKQLTAQGW